MRKITFILMLFVNYLMFSQETIPASGGEATGSGTVSYSIGQLVYTTNADSDGSISQGIQQSIEFFTLSNPELVTVTLSAVVYPNPTTDNVILTLSDSSLTDLSYSMYNITGQEVSKGIVEEGDTLLSMQELATGIYILKVNQNNQALKIFKIIKK